MEQIPTPKKQRRFLKAIGRVAGVLVQELALGLGRKYIGKMINKIKISKKREMLSFLLVLSCTFAFAQYPATGNKQRLGFQTSGDGLVFRGRSSDTTALKPSTINNAYHLFDTINNVLFSYIKTKGGWKFNNSDTVIINGVTMPFDSITFNTAKDGTVGVGEVEYNDTQGSLIQGLKGGNVTNVIGQQLHQRVNNRTGILLAKGTAIYLSGSQGNRITVAKALGITDAFSANTFGIVAESIANNQSGYVITEGLITGINTSALTEGAAVYLSPTVAGELTSTKPQAPQHTVYIGVCVKSNAGSGELFVKIFNGQELEELHNVRIDNPSNNASLYYKSNESLWRDTTAALLVSDTATMLTPYLRSDLGTTNFLSIFSGARTLSNSVVQQSSSNIGINTTPFASLTLGQGKNIMLDASSNNVPRILFYETNARNENDVQFGAKIQYNSPSDRLEFIMRDSFSADPSGDELAISILRQTGNVTIHKDLNVTGNLTESGNNVITSADTSTMLLNYLQKGVASATYQTKLTNPITGNGSNLYFPIFTSSSNITQSLLRWDGNSIPNSTFINDYNFNQFSALAGTGTRMVVASSTGLLSTQTIGTSVSTFSAGTTGFTPSTATSGAVTLGGTLAIANGGTGATTASTARTALGATVRGANVFTLSDISQVSFIRYNADNTVSQRTAEGIRLDLGGTTIGQSMFMLTNPSAVTFPRFNADNTVTALDAASFRTAIGVGTGAGTVTSVSAGSPANGLSVANGTTTPVISMALAASGTIGVVSATTQTFSGNKTFSGTIDVSSTGTFGGRVNTPWLERQYNSSTSSSFTVGVNTSWLDINTNVLTTITLPNPATYPGKELHIRQTGTGQLQSLNSNVIPFTSPPTGSAGTAILNPTNNKAVTLVSDGVNWIIMQRSTN